jgi:hypothetical protein
MSLYQQAYRRTASFALVLTIVLVALSTLMNAQDESFPKAEWFVGYQWLNPGGDVPGQSTPPTPPPAFKLPSISPGMGTSLAYNFTKYLALEGNFGFDYNHTANVEAFTVGPKLTFRGEGVNFFVHTLFGWERLGARTRYPSFASNGIAAVLGGGMDLKLWKPLSLRLFEADYQLSRQNFAAEVPPTDGHLRRPIYNGARLSTGLVFNFGGPPPVPPAAACSIDKSEVQVGEPLHVTVTPSNFNPKHTLKYEWSSTGGKIEGKETGATIDTAGAAPGSYTATARVSDPKMKKGGEASCTSNFTLKPLNPPQLSCSATPTTVEVGTPSTISCTCTSPDNATVTVGNWTASAGSISGSGNSATLTTTGASPGPITVNATCTDSRGLTASTSTTVTVNAPPPPPPPPPQATKVNECEYPNKKKPWRVDNTCKAALDDVALKLQQDPEAKLIVVGNSEPKEKRKNLAAERAVDVKAYLSGGEAKQNIDPSRIETRTSTEGTANTEQWIVPSGGTFPEASSTTPVDESKVKPIPDHPKPAAKKRAKKAQ